MDFLKEISRYVVKYGEIALNKTEILARMAKLKIEIKKREIEIEKVKAEIGEYVINQFENKTAISEDVIKLKIDSLNSFKNGIDELKLQFESLKTKLWETGTETKEEKQTE